MSKKRKKRKILWMRYMLLLKRIPEKTHSGLITITQ